MARSRRSRGLPGLWRTLNYLAFLPLASRAPDYGRLLFALVQDPRVPAARKAALAAAGAYLVSPIDLIPEWVPLLGAVDDVMVVVLALEVFFAGLPAELIDEKLGDLGLDSAAFHEDRAVVRRFIPRPLRHAASLAPRVATRVPPAARQAGDLARRSGADRRVRALFRMEDLPA